MSYPRMQRGGQREGERSEPSTNAARDTTTRRGSAGEVPSARARLGWRDGEHQRSSGAWDTTARRGALARTSGYSRVPSANEPGVTVRDGTARRGGRAVWCEVAAATDAARAGPTKTGRRATIALPSKFQSERW